MTPFLEIAFGVLLFSALLCLYRIARGPTAPDRTVAIDILGTLIVGFCCVMAIRDGADYYISVAIAWALISFVGTLALAKFLEGRTYDA